MKGWLSLCGILPVCLLFIVQVGFAPAEIIPAGRRVDWTGMAGVKGGIPNRTVIYADVVSAGAVGDGIADDWSAIQASINDCPSDQVVYIPPGTYRLTKRLVLKERTTLRGAGPSSVLEFDASDFSGGSSCVWLGGDTLYTPSIVHELVSGYTRGSTSVVLAATAGVFPGSFALIDQQNDSSFVDNTGASYLSRESGGRLIGQYVEVLTTNDSTITFTPPLAWGYSNALHPQLVPATRVWRLAGLEDLTISNISTSPRVHNVMWDLGRSVLIMAPTP